MLFLISWRYPCNPSLTGACRHLAMYFLSLVFLLTAEGFRQPAPLRFALVESHWPPKWSSWTVMKTALVLGSLPFGPHQVHRNTHSFFTLISSGTGDRFRNNYFFAAKAAGWFLLLSRCSRQMSASPLCVPFS